MTEIAERLATFEKTLKISFEPDIALMYADLLEEGGQMGRAKALREMAELIRQCDLMDFTRKYGGVLGRTMAKVNIEKFMKAKFPDVHFRVRTSESMTDVDIYMDTGVLARHSDPKYIVLTEVDVYLQNFGIHQGWSYESKWFRQCFGSNDFITVHCWRDREHQDRVLSQWRPAAQRRRR